jgi:hypothetical protein
MNQQSHEQNKKPGHTEPVKKDDANQQKQKAEQEEVAGRHKNEGRNDHKGHKESR